MNKKVLIAAISALLVGCSSEELIIETKYPLDSTPLVIKANITSGIESKAIKTEKVFADGDEICVRLDVASLTDGAHRNWGSYYRYNSAQNAWNYYTLGDHSASRIYLGNEEHTLTAFYPAPKLVDDGAGGKKYDIEIFNQDNGGAQEGFGLGDKAGIKLSYPAMFNSLDGSDQKDIMVGYTYDELAPTVAPTVSKAKSAVELRFHHLMSKLELVINKSNEYVSPGLLTEVVLVDNKTNFYELSNDQFDGSFIMLTKDPKVCTLLNPKNALNRTIGFKNETGVNINNYAETASTNVVSKGLIVPRDTQTNGTVTFKLKIDGRVYLAVIPYDPASTTGFKGSFKPGTNYKFTFTLFTDEIRISNISISDWAEGAKNTDPVIVN